MRYFAYGSNMLTARLRKRAPSARPIGMAALQGHILRWHKRGRDGSGKCDACHTGGAGDVVLGVIFDVSDEDRRSLDRAEGVGSGYEVKQVEIASGPTSSTAFTYTADPAAIAADLEPFSWYQVLVVAGAREHELPASYVTRLEAQTSQADPDESRAFRARRILGGAGA